MICAALDRICAFALPTLALVAVATGADAAGLATKLKAPDGRRIAEQGVEGGARPAGSSLELQVPGGDLIDWRVSAQTALADGPETAKPLPKPGLSSRLNLRTAAADVSWVCTVEIPRAGPDGAVQGKSTLLAGIPMSGLLEVPLVGGPSRVDLEWSGSGTSPVEGGGLVALRSMVGAAVAPHAGKMQGWVRWDGGLVLTAAREWTGDGTQENVRNRVGVRRGFRGDGWGLELRGGAGTTYEGDAATDSLVLDAAGRVVHLPGAVLTVAAGYERRWDSAEDSERFSVEFGADLTRTLATTLPDVLQPRFRIAGSASSVAPGGQPRLRLEELRGRVEMGWRF